MFVLLSTIKNNKASSLPEDVTGDNIFAYVYLGVFLGLLF